MSDGSSLTVRFAHSGGRMEASWTSPLLVASFLLAMYYYRVWSILCQVRGDKAF